MTSGILPAVPECIDRGVPPCPTCPVQDYCEYAARAMYKDDDRVARKKISAAGRELAKRKTKGKIWLCKP